MIEQEIPIVNKLGLHVRAATLLVQTASEHDSAINLHYNGQSADAKSIMEVLMLAATKGSMVKVSVEGDSPDEEETAMQALDTLISNRFNEAE